MGSVFDKRKKVERNEAEMTPEKMEEAKEWAFHTMICASHGADPNYFAFFNNFLQIFFFIVLQIGSI